MYDENEITPIGNTQIGGGNWVEYILKTPLPNIKNEKAFKAKVINFLKPMMETANKTNLTRKDIAIAMTGYHKLWLKIPAYFNEGRRDADLIMLRKSLEEAYWLELHRSIGMGQMAMIFQPQKIQHVFSRFADDTKRKLNFFKSKEPQERMPNTMEE